MKRFILRTIGFTAPFYISFLAYTLFGSATNGDLVRMGYLVDRGRNHGRLFADAAVPAAYHYQNLSELNDTSSKAYDALIIGDSFSHQDLFNYQNYLAQQYGHRLVCLSAGAKNNPIQILYNALNGGVLDSVRVKYVVLQSVERAFVNRCQNLNTASKLSYKAAQKLDAQFVHPPDRAAPEENPETYFFSDGVLKFPLYNLLYGFDDNAFLSRVYRAQTSTPLFAVPSQELLFYDDDLAFLPLNNTPEKVAKANASIERLAERLREKGMELILLVSPDKYGLYYPYLADQQKYPAPLFFQHFEALPKNYRCINAHQLLRAQLPATQDLYYYGDTHWSPYGSRLVAAAIHEQLASAE